MPYVRRYQVALTRTESIDETLSASSDPDATYGALRDAFAAVGKMKTEDPSFRRLVGRIYSGAAGMNSATVTVSVSANPQGGSDLHVNASAQEGLIKQHTAPRAVSRLLEAFKQIGGRMAAPEDVTEGWQNDPSGRFPDRYWDGTAWTQWVRDKPGGTRFEDDPVAPPQGPAAKASGSSTTVSIADELRKLAELRDSGELTNDEFTVLKNRLLGDGPG
jgi:Short C-terminal domain